MPPSTAIRNSVIFAAISTVFALAIGVPATYLLIVPRRRLRLLLDPLFMLPLGTSAVTLGFGYLIALDKPPLNLRASPLLVPIAHTLIAFPFVVRALLPVLKGINPRLREAAAMLGASPARVRWEVDAPIVARAIMIGAVFAFTISLGEFGATLLINRPEYPDHASGDLPLPGTTRHRQLWASSRHEYAPDAGHGGRIHRHRAAARRRPGRVLAGNGHHSNGVSWLHIGPIHLLFTAYAGWQRKIASNTVQHQPNQHN